MEEKRSRGVGVFGRLTIILAIFHLLNLIVYYVIGHRVYHSPIHPVPTLIYVLYMLFLVIIGWGILKVKFWARKLTLFVFVPLLIIVLPWTDVIRKLHVPIILEIIRILYGLSVLFYFTRAKVKAQFSPPKPTTSA